MTTTGAIAPATGRLGMRFERAIWVMPAAFSLHIAEEYLGGFPAWVGTQMHGAMSIPVFAVNNAVFMAILLGVVAWAAMSRGRTSAFVCLAWASGNLFWDFWVHLLTTVFQRVYSPGLLTATLLYYPISLWVAWLAVRDARLGRRGVVGAFAVGLALLLFVMWAGLWHFHVPAA